MELSLNTRRKQFTIVVVVAAVLVVAAVALTLYGHSSRPATPVSEAESRLNSALPVQTPHYKISFSYSTTSKQFAYQITLYAIINRPSEYDSYIAELKQYKQEALAYITDHGENPAKLSISYLPPQAAGL